MVHQEEARDELVEQEQLLIDEEIAHQEGALHAAWNMQKTRLRGHLPTVTAPTVRLAQLELPRVQQLSAENERQLVVAMRDAIVKKVG